MKDILDFQKERKRADAFFKKSLLCYGCCGLFCLAAAICPEGTIEFCVCLAAAGGLLLAGLCLLCLAQSEGQEPYIVESDEEKEEIDMDELKKILETAEKNK